MTWQKTVSTLQKESGLYRTVWRYDLTAEIVLELATTTTSCWSCHLRIGSLAVMVPLSREIGTFWQQGWGRGVPTEEELANLLAHAVARGAALFEHAVEVEEKEVKYFQKVMDEKKHRFNEVCTARGIFNQYKLAQETK
jgi:hypothetical protein